MEYRIMNIRGIREAQLRLWFSQAGEQRRENILHLRRTEDQLRSLCADHLARQMLSERLHCAPTDLTFRRTEKGKPCLEGTPLHFNLSHSGDFVACAVDNFPIGIDIEATRAVRQELCRKVCTQKERAYVFQDGSFSPERFLLLWTAKEAVLKQKGTGICADLSTLSVFKDGCFFFPPLSFFQEVKGGYILSIAYLDSVAGSA